MKKLVIILSVLFISLSSFATELSGNFYMVSSGEKLFCKNIRVGSHYIKATLENGEKVVIPTSEVKMYRVDGAVFEKLPVYVNNKSTNREIFMEFVATRGGLKLYKYSNYEGGVDKVTGAYLGVSKVDHYLVFRGDKFHVEVTDKNYITLFEFFRIKVV